MKNCVRARKLSLIFSRKVNGQDSPLVKGELKGVVSSGRHAPYNLLNPPLSGGTLRLSLLALVFLIAVNGCFRGRPSENPPINLNPNMDNQPRYDPQSESRFFADGASMRPPVPGTVAREELRGDAAYYQGKGGDGQFLNHSPVPTTMQLLERGQERYNIFCSPCHGRTGDGKGIVVQRGYLPPPSYHQDRVRQFADGYIFDVITNGVRNMPSYRHEVPVDDRWAIVAYLRALQRSENATINDVPEEIRKTLR